MYEVQTEDVPSWYAIHTKPKQEDRADSNLRAWQVETFAPKIKQRNYNKYVGKATFVTKPLFPNYIFAKFKASALLHKVCFTRGVQSVVCFGDKPTPIDESIIKIIQSQKGPDGLIRLGEDLQPGEKVVISDGPLQSFVGIFEGNLKDEERVSILLITVSYQTRVIIERDSVKRLPQKGAPV